MYLCARFSILLVMAAAAMFGQGSDPDSFAPEIIPQSAAEPDLSFQWKSAVLQSLLAAGIANAERYSRERGTRAALEGPFFKNYLHDIESFHGWQDGDGVKTSYVAHPMEGSMAAYIERQNDPRYRSVEFSNSQRYWVSVVRSLAFSTAYSIVWSMGPLGESPWGNVELHAPPGLVDLVGTQVMGIGWMIGEDMLDRYLIKRIEYRYRNPIVRAVARGMLNPTRSYANLLRFQVPWNRDDRSIFTTYRPEADLRPRDSITGPKFDSRAWPKSGAFELNSEAMFERFLGAPGKSCGGGAGEGAIKLTKASAIVIRVDGCQVFGFPSETFGDTLDYMAGPRWRVASAGRWQSYVQLLAGGTKVTHSYADKALKKTLTAAALAQGKDTPDEESWTTEWDTNGFTMAASGIVAWQINHGMLLRVADVSYQRSWISELQGVNYDRGLRYTFGLTLRMGDWDR
ncbi:MAG TPA: hypothetical protein VKB79_20190 [Bryobacteraceae bacterium]|nr:hypothetical protein [Bryobacteraceae bacterium]